jgi:hypothetical protein
MDTWEDSPSCKWGGNTRCSTRGNSRKTAAAAVVIRLIFTTATTSTTINIQSLQLLQGVILLFLLQL